MITLRVSDRPDVVEEDRAVVVLVVMTVRVSGSPKVAVLDTLKLCECPEGEELKVCDGLE